MSYTFKELIQRYNNALNPTAKVKIDGRDITKDMAVRLVEVELSTKTALAGSAKIAATVFSEQPDGKQLLSAFPLMGEIKIELGYENSTLPVFEGIILERQWEIKGSLFGGILVSCLDKKALFRKNNDFAIYSVKSYSALLNNIVSKYGLKTEAKDLPEFDKAVDFNQNGVSDFDFIVNIANELGCEFFILNNTIYFRPVKSVNENLVTVEYKDLESAKQISSVAKSFTEFKAFTYNQNKNEDSDVVCSTVSKKIGSGKTAPEVLKSKGHNFVMRDSVYTNNNTVKNLSAWANARLQENSMQLTLLSLSTVGFPEFVPGKIITLENVAPGADNSYYIEATRHIFDGSYKTEFECRSNTITY